MFRHDPAGLEFGTVYRVDSAAGSSTPVTVYHSDGTGSPVETMAGASGSTIRTVDPRGRGAVFYATQATLYLKPLDYLGGQLGSGVVTSSGAAPAVLPTGGAVGVQGVAVNSYGADPTGSTDSTAAFVSALASLPTVTVRATPSTPGQPGSGGSGTSASYPIGTLILGPGRYVVGTSADVGNLGPFVSVIGAGHNATVIDYRGAGDALRAYNAVRPAFDSFYTLTGMAGTFDGFTLRGTSALAGAAGLHIGDAEGFILGNDLYVHGFNKAGSRGIFFDNQYSWTENARGVATVYDCTTCVEFQAGNGATVQNGFTGGDNSFMYNDLCFKVYCMEQQNGVVLSQGATYQGGCLRVFANMANNNAATTNALLTLTGTCPTGHLGSGTYSQLTRTDLYLHGETNGGGANKPQTIKFGDVGANAIVDCAGGITFAGNWTPTNFTLAGSFAQGNVKFMGTIVGDANLAPADGVQSTTSFIYGRTILFPDGGFPVRPGDFASITLSASFTVNFQQTQAGPQRKTLVIQQAASGGPYTVTWPSSVKWAGGTKPTMTAAANAVDVYYLETYDGATWYGRASQNVS
jgi:hypothetical protein